MTTCEMIKPDLFEVSECNKESSKINTLYFLEDQGLPLTKKNIKKHSEKMFQKRVEDIKNPLCPVISITNVTLKCSITKKELGYYIKQSYQYWDVLSLVFVNKEYRNQGLSTKLINHFEDNSKEITLVELNKNDFSKTKDIYSKWGYDQTVHNFFPNSVALIKKESGEMLIDAHKKSNDSVIAQQKVRFVKTHNKVMKLLRNCDTVEEILAKKKKLSKIFDDVRWDQDSFFEYELKTNHPQSPWYKFVEGFYGFSKAAA